MKSKTPLIPLFSFILAISYLPTTHAVTDAELEALEKQIEQQENIEKKKANAVIKRKTDEKLKANVEAEKKQRQEELRLLEEERSKLEEEKRELEITRQAELERKRLDEVKKRAEEEKKKKYNSLVTEAKESVNNRDKELAISKFNNALTLYPNDSEAEFGIKDAEKLMDKACYNVLGEWIDFGNKIMVKPDGTVESYNMVLGAITAKWKCLDSETQSFLFFDHSCGGICPDLKAQIINNGACLNFEIWGCHRRRNPTNENNKTTGPDIKL
jgi:hypothetical protein